METRLILNIQIIFLVCTNGSDVVSNNCVVTILGRRTAWSIFSGGAALLNAIELQRLCQGRCPFKPFSKGEEPSHLDQIGQGPSVNEKQSEKLSHLQERFLAAAARNKKFFLADKTIFHVVCTPYSNRLVDEKVELTI